MVLAVAMAQVASALEKKVVTIWDWSIHDKTYKKRAFAKFSAEHPDIQLKCTSAGPSIPDRGGRCTVSWA